MPTWPASLPQTLLVSLTRTRQNGKIRSSMDTGPAKQRARFTAVAKEFPDGAEYFTGAQLAIFDTFYEDDLGMGALSFTWIDPITDASATMRFGNGEPEDVCIVNDPDPDKRLYRVTLPLEILP